MRRLALVLISLLVVTTLGALTLRVVLTPWTFHTVGGQLVRVARWDGHAELLREDGWVPLRAGVMDSVHRAEARRRAPVTGDPFADLALPPSAPRGTPPEGVP